LAALNNSAWSTFLAVSLLSLIISILLRKL
jgi:hypothetical protein